MLERKDGDSPGIPQGTRVRPHRLGPCQDQAGCRAQCAPCSQMDVGAAPIIQQPVALPLLWHGLACLPACPGAGRGLWSQYCQYCLLSVLITQRLCLCSSMAIEEPRCSGGAQRWTSQVLNGKSDCSSFVSLLPCRE